MKASENFGGSLEEITANIAYPKDLASEKILHY